MTQEEKQLLLQDLCTRLPFGVNCQFTWTYYNETTNGEDVIAKEDDNIKCININTKEIQAAYYNEWVDLEHCKPYLRPMSSMTEEERKMVCTMNSLSESELDDRIKYQKMYVNSYTIETFDLFNFHHFDYRGFIEMGLALEAPEGMYE